MVRSSAGDPAFRSAGDTGGVHGWRAFVRFTVLVFAVGQIVSGLLIFWAVGLLVAEALLALELRRARARHPTHHRLRPALASG